MAKKDDYYITFLKYAREKRRIGEGIVEYADVFEHVHSIHREVSEEAFKRTFLQAVVTVQFIGREAHPEDIGKIPMVLTLEAYFQLLEHEELQEARQASNRALIVAIAAFLVSSAAVITSVFVQGGAL